MQRREPSEQPDERRAEIDNQTSGLQHFIENGARLWCAYGVAIGVGTSLSSVCTSDQRPEVEPSLPAIDTTNHLTMKRPSLDTDERLHAEWKRPKQRASSFALSLNSLSDEVILQCFSYLSATDLLGAQASRRLYDLANDGQVCRISLCISTC